MSNIKKEVLRKPTWKYSPAMKKAQLEAFIKEHGIPEPNHPKRPELMLLVSDYVTHLIMDDMRRHEQGEPLQNTSKEQIEAMKAQLKGLKIPSVASVDFPKVEVKKPKVEIKKEPKKEIIIDKEPIGDKTKYTPKDFIQADIDSVLNDIKKVEKKLEKPKNLEEYRKLQEELTSLLNEAQRLKAEMNRGDGKRRRNRGGNFGSDLLGVLDKIGKFGKNIPIVGPAFEPMANTLNIANAIKPSGRKL
jgi:hypothetical protein